MNKLSDARRNRIVFIIFSTIILLILYIFLAGPLVLIISNSFKPMAEINQGSLSLIPHQFTWENYNTLFSDPIFKSDMFNSLKIALITMVLAMVLSVPTSYAMARYRNKITSGMMVWILLSQMIPGILTVVPLFDILNKVNLINTHAGLIICYAVWSLPFSCWMMRGFISGVPIELEEAARIDGCSTLQMLVHILIPIIIPGILTAGVFAFVGAWNELLFALCIMTGDPMLQTLPLKLSTYVGQSGGENPGIVAAASFISSIPGIIIFAFSQRFFVKGLTSGSIK